MSEIGSTHFFPVSVTGTGAYTLDSSPRQPTSTIRASGKGYLSLGALTVTSGNQTGRRYRGCEVALASTDAEDETVTVRVYRVVHIGQAQDTDKMTADNIVSLLGTITFTVGAATFAAADDTYSGQTLGRVLGDSYLIADTAVWTKATTASSPTGVGDYVASGYAGGIDCLAHSPADDTAAFVVLNDVGNADLYFDVNATASTVAALLVRPLT